MNRRLLDDVVDDADQPRIDSEEIVERFTNVAEDYIEHAKDPTTEPIEVLLVHFADRDPDELDEETLSVMWTLTLIIRWMVDDLPLQDQLRDPEWLAERLSVLEQYGLGKESELDVNLDAVKGRVKKLIDDIAQDQDNGAPKEKVVERISDVGIEPEAAEDVLNMLMMNGEIVETDQNTLETKHYD
jgi:hypothetical protein